MATATSNQQAVQNVAAATQSPLDEFLGRSVHFTPLAEEQEIEISIGAVMNFIAVKSKSGRQPGNSDVVKFLQLCKSRRLNPYVGDAYLIGYDTKDGTKWNIITAIQALRKRAEANPNYRGTECGVIIRTANGGRKQRQGAMTDDGERLLGGWARVYREDRTKAAYASVKLSVYDTGQSRWAKDPGGMIVKVAEAASLREAFPSDLAGMYIRDEFDRETDEGHAEQRHAAGVAGLKERLLADNAPTGAECDPGNPSAPTAEELADQFESEGQLFEKGNEEYR